MVEIITGATLFIIGIIVLGWLRERVRAKLLTGQRQEFSAVRSHDQVFDGVPLGVLPSGHESAPTRQASSDEVRAPVAVRFDPPQGLLPEQTGMLRLAMTTSRDIAAAFTALIVAGHVLITRHEILVGHGSARTEWWLKTVHPPEDGELRIWLYDQITQLPAPHTLDALRQILRHHGSAARTRYAQNAQHRSWHARMDHAGGRSRGFSQGRSAEVTALRYQLEGFRRFLETADGDRLRFEEGAGLFTRYLPWAVALDLTDHWGAALRSAMTGLDDASRERWLADLSWAGGLNPAHTPLLSLTVADLSAQLTSWNVVGDAAGGSGGSGEFGGGDFWHGDFSGYASGYSGGS